MQRPTKKKTIALLTTIAVVAIPLWVATWMLVFENHFNDEDFDRTTWLRLAGDMRSDNPRGLMAEDLIDKLERDRIARADAIALLGPSEHPCSQPIHGRTSTCLSYIVGMWSGLRWDYDSLDVFFDDNSVFSGAEIVQH